MAEENNSFNEADVQPQAKAAEKPAPVPPNSGTPTRKLFPIYDMAGEGGLSQKGLGIFILCATAAVGAFVIYMALR